jgi:galactokinase/mevalonate kinase-like predicted kinase
MGLKFAASAPGRCGIVGNPSDIYGGRVLSCSLPARATCILSECDKWELPEDPKLWDAAVARFPLQGKWRVEWETQIPRSSGLSGSTALLASTLACVLAANEEPLPRRTEEDRLAAGELIRDIERNEAGIVCGYQDAAMIVHGGLQFMDFAGKHPTQTGPVPKVTSLNAELPFLLITTGVERLSGSVHSPMADRWLNGDADVIDGMIRIGKLADIGAKAMLAADWAALAEAMTENHAIVHSLGGSGEPIDRLIASALECGAGAAKLAGAGLGGTVIALTSDSVALRAGLEAKGYSRFIEPKQEPGLRYEAIADGRGM